MVQTRVCFSVVLALAVLICVCATFGLCYAPKRSSHRPPKKHFKMLYKQPTAFYPREPKFFDRYNANKFKKPMFHKGHYPGMNMLDFDDIEEEAHSLSTHRLLQNPPTAKPSMVASFWSNATSCSETVAPTVSLMSRTCTINPALIDTFVYIQCTSEDRLDWYTCLSSACNLNDCIRASFSTGCLLTSTGSIRLTCPSSSTGASPSSPATAPTPAPTGSATGGAVPTPTSSSAPGSTPSKPSVPPTTTDVPTSPASTSAPTTTTTGSPSEPSATSTSSPVNPVTTNPEPSAPTGTSSPSGTGAVAPAVTGTATTTTPPAATTTHPGATSTPITIQLPTLPSNVTVTLSSTSSPRVALATPLLAAALLFACLYL